MFELTSMFAVKLISRSVRLVEMQPDGSVMMIILRESPSATKNEGFVASLMLGGQSYYMERCSQQWWQWCPCLGLRLRRMKEKCDALKANLRIQAGRCDEFSTIMTLFPYRWSMFPS